MSIYIFSRPIHSGKTTKLLQWCNLQNNIYGLLMPDINGIRNVFDLHTQSIFTIECTDITNTNEALTSIGKFHFYTEAFEKANLILSNALNQKPGWLVIDEVGKLELDGKGFYASVKKAVEFYNTNMDNGHLLITIRETLCEEVITFFKIKNYKIIHQLEEII
ncbi:MAG TPA: nucleoside-triphosphatase [Ferruginibacter sp.]|nr:nucleoside-triphosphatase [Ferruginibacter sp.]